MPTSPSALPCPCTSFRAFSAACRERSISAPTDAAREASRADADAAAEEADARADSTTSDAEEATEDGGSPEKRAVSGAVGRSLNAGPPVSSFPVSQDTRPAAPRAVTTTAAAALTARVRTDRLAPADVGFTGSVLFSLPWCGRRQ
ncbi:hypothetical protein [Streptomyces tanashiensis]